MADTPNTPINAQAFAVDEPRAKSDTANRVLATFRKDSDTRAVYVALKSLSESDRNALRAWIATVSKGATLLGSDIHTDADKLKTHCNSAKMRKALGAITVGIVRNADSDPVGVKITRNS